MRETYKDWVATGLLKKGKSKGGLAKVLGVHQSQITRLLVGGRQIKAEEIPLIARYLQESPPAEAQFEAETPDEAAPTVRVIGYVGAGAEMHFYSFSQGDMDEVPAPVGTTESTVAVEVRGDSLGSLFDRWLVFYDDVRSPVTSDLLGKLCVVGLSDDRVLIKKIRRAENNLFDLLSDDKREDPIKGVVIQWAAKVKHMEPK